LEFKGKKMKIVKKLLGIDKIEQDLIKAKEALEEAQAKQIEAEKATALAQEQEELSKLSPKDRATRRKEPWVGVLNTHVNQDNIRNGFFELDWNEHFVLKLKQEGYGADGDLDEEIVDRWFRELCANVVVDGDYGGSVQTGSLDIQTIKRNN
jgi:hypothetical protein